MTLTYYFGETETSYGEEFEYQISVKEAYGKLVVCFFGEEGAKKVRDFYDDFVDYWDICEGYIETVQDLYEAEAYDVWKNGIKCGRE